MQEDQIALAVELFEKMLQLLHPFMPFITEELWTHVRPREKGDSCMMSSWPEQNATEMNTELAGHFGTMQELISGIRNIKAQYGVSPGQDISTLLILEPALVGPVESHRDYFAKLARVHDLTISTDAKRPPASASAVVGRNQVFVPLEGMIDLEVERERLRKEIEGKGKFVRAQQGKLSNENFVGRAPAAVVEKERVKLEEAKEELGRLQSSLDELG